MTTTSRAFPKFESYGILEMAASVGWKVKDGNGHGARFQGARAEADECTGSERDPDEVKVA